MYCKSLNLFDCPFCSYTDTLSFQVCVYVCVYMYPESNIYTYLLYMYDNLSHWIAQVPPLLIFEIYSS